MDTDLSSQLIAAQSSQTRFSAQVAIVKKNPEMEHADENMVTVAPGKSGEIFWQFTKAGKIDFACLQPGHYDAGMKGAVSVAAGKVATTRVGGNDHKH